MEAVFFKQFGLFLLVGITNTVLDFLGFNLLTRRPLQMGRIPANLISSTTGMVFGFTMNLLLVFLPQHADVPARAAKFVLVNAFSLYVLQSAIILALTRWWHLPASLLFRATNRLIPSAHLDEDFVSRNIAKVFATAASLTTNFVCYKFFVYA